MGFKRAASWSLFRFLDMLPKDYSDNLARRMNDGLQERLGARLPPHYDLDLPGGHLRIVQSADAPWLRQNWHKEHKRAKEEETMRWIREHIEPDETLFDIGSHIGLYSLYAAKWKKIRVCAFEPHEETFRTFTANINLNGCNSRISPYNIALSDRSQLGALYAGHPYDYSRTFVPEAEKASLPAAAKLLHPMMSMPLDTFRRLFAIPPPAHIKLDVDGLELEILKGAAETLPAIRSLMIEVEEDLARNAERNLLPLLRAAGLEEVPIAEPCSGRNRLFVNRARAAAEHA